MWDWQNHPPTSALPLGPPAGPGDQVWGGGLSPHLARCADFSSSWPAPSSAAGPGPPPGEGPTGCRRERRQERGRSQERRQPSSSSSEKQRFYSCDRFGGREPSQPKPSLSSHPTSPTAGQEPGPPRPVRQDPSLPLLTSSPLPMLQILLLVLACRPESALPPSLPHSSPTSPNLPPQLPWTGLWSLLSPCLSLCHPLFPEHLPRPNWHQLLPAPPPTTHPTCLLPRVPTSLHASPPTSMVLTRIGLWSSSLIFFSLFSFLAGWRFSEWEPLVVNIRC